MSVRTAPRVEAPSLQSPSLRRKPSVAWYWIGGLVAVLGAIVSIGWGVTRVLDAYNRVDSFSRTQIPGEVQVHVTEPGRQILYYEGDSRPLWTELGLQVRSNSGNPIAVRPYRPDLRYDFAGRVAKAVASFDAQTVGNYLVSTEKSPDIHASLAVGEDLTSIIPTVLLAVFLSLLSVVAGAVVAALTYNRRSRS